MATIRIYGDPVLRRKADEVTSFDDEIREFVDQMKEDMLENDGVGLAAPQVGRSIRVTVIDATGGEEEPIVFINPEITHFSEERSDYEEGCLSIPDVTLKINRSSSVSVKAQDENGDEFEIKDAEGLLARALQHEIDHLNGILFVDRASLVARQLVSGKLKKLAKSARENVQTA